jgi:O-antigen ligase
MKRRDGNQQPRMPADPRDRLPLGPALPASRMAFGSRWPAIAWFMLLLPHFATPIWGPYRPPAASIYLLIWVGLMCGTNAALRLRVSDDTGLRWKILAFFFYALVSGAYGYWQLSQAGQLTLHLTTGDIGYGGIAGQRLFQLVLVILAFEAVRLSRIPLVQLMRWWLIGMTIAIGLHVLTYLGSSDSLVQRAGIFNEGNLGGLYYLLSVFVALEYRRRGDRREGLVFACLAVLGIVLAASSASILVLAATLSLTYVLRARTASAKLRRAFVTVAAVVSIGALMVLTGSDFAIAEKLFEEEVTSKSFSRIDRLASIDTAIELFLQSPWFGHGLQSYGFLANDYLDGPLLAVYNQDFRRIPNNIYAELAAEMGIVGLLLFGNFIVALLSRIAASRADGGRNLLGGVLAVLGYWLAFPTYSVVFVWAFFGLAVTALRAGPPPLVEPPGRPAVVRRRPPGATLPADGEG